MAAYGVPHLDIARIIGVSRPTLEKHYPDELDLGTTRMISAVAGRLYSIGMRTETVEQPGPNGTVRLVEVPLVDRSTVAALIFILKARGGWRETSVLEVKPGEKPFEEMTNEELEAYVAAERRAENSRARDAGEADGSDEPAGIRKRNRNPRPTLQ